MSGLYENTMHAKEMYDRAFAQAGRGKAVRSGHLPRPGIRGLVTAIRSLFRFPGGRQSLERKRVPLPR